MVPVDFPSRVMKVRNPAVAPTYRTRPGHAATNAMQRSAGLAGAQWRLRFDVLVHDETTMRAFRAFLYNMEADTALVRIEPPDRYGIDGPYTPIGQAARAQYPNGIPFASGVMHSTGAGHAIPTLKATFGSAAALNDRIIHVSENEQIPAGCAISIDGFCYGIAGSWTEGGQQRLKISPPLRKPAAMGDTILLAPYFIGFCVTDAPGFEALVQGYYGEHTLEFVEDLTRLVGNIS